jgi:hypothetical protein
VAAVKREDMRAGGPRTQGISNSQNAIALEKVDFAKAMCGQCRMSAPACYHRLSKFGDDFN